jgi:hypothetical protein
MDQVSAAQSGLFVNDNQIQQGVAGLLGLFGLEPPGLLGRSLGLGAAFQLQKPHEPSEMVFAAADGSRGASGPSPHSAVAERSAIERFDQPRLPALRDFHDGLVAVQFDSAYVAAIQTGAVEELEDV